MPKQFLKCVAHVKEKLQIYGNQKLKWVQNPTANIGQCPVQGV